MENRGRHRIGISQNQPHINADVAPQKYNGTEGLLQENARRMVVLPVLNYHVFRYRYTNLELTDMVLIYGEALSNGGAARRLYMKRFPGRQVPCERTFVSAVQHLRDYGTFSPVNRNHNLENAARTRITSLSSSTCPTLKTRRSTMSIAFCQWLLQKIDEEPNFLSIILTTDEAGCTRDGVFNSHNTHIWSEENPHQIRERGFQQRFSTNVWAGIIGNRLIGPHVLPPHLNLNLNELSDLLDDVPLQIRRDMCSFTGQPDFNPCDFFLWGHLKQIVYETPVNTVEELTVRVNNAAESIRRNSDMLVRTQASMARRAQACIDNAKGYFQVTDEEVALLLEEGTDIQLFTENILAETAEAKRILASVEERHQQLLQIERMLTEVRDLFVQMSIIIDSQQELVDRIEYQAQSATNYIGAVDLGAVRRSKRKYLKVKDIFKI
ncbi:hypothetical protein GEV33_009808 [Tenebrio molitor]|uniref:t-SNARE coiled-coil homology domain-containing protein n=1 Tax=Tenebrio molitor TaxID=7067 RepID=A0A8J6HEJ4_TENMO|nr:hypothetical protein GEV33_009808 [Tenebrio molitor]